MSDRRSFFLSVLAAGGSAAALLWGSVASAQSAPKVQQAWARPTVEGQAGGGGFLKITGGASADRLLSARAGVAQRVELHTMSMDGGVMRMREIEAIEVPAGQTVELKPGGMHVMLMGLKAPLKTGASFPLTLRFEKAGELTVDMQVMARPAVAAAADEHKHKH